MSLTPIVPNNLSTVAKSFWDRKEGKTGMAVLAVAGLSGAALLVYGWAIIVPFLAAAAASTLNLAITCGILAFLFYLVTNKQVRNLVKNIFQLSMRWTTGMFVAVDPIGILKNNLDDMRARKVELDNNTAKLAGSKRGLEMSIKKNQDAVNHDKSLIDQISKQLAGKDPNSTEGRQLVLQRQLKLTDAGMKMKSIDNQNNLLKQTNKMYDMLLRWRDLADYNIQNTQNQMENYAEERKQMLAASGALNAVSRLIKGDPEQVKIVDQALEYLADSTANTLGEMDDFANYSDKFLTGMDIENGAAADDAEKMFAGFEQKLVSNGKPSTQTVINMTQNASGVYVPANTTPNTASNTSDYNSYFK